MNNNRNPSFKPGQREVDEITKRARKGARDGAIVGGTVGYAGGALLPRGLRKARFVGAAVGTGGGYIVGKKVARKVAAKDDIASRRALREMTARIDRLVQLADARDGGDEYQEMIDQARAKVRRKYGAKVEAAMSNEQILAAVERRADDSGNSFLPGAFHRADDVTRFDTWMATSAISRDANGNLLEGQSRQHPVRVYPKVRKPYSVDGVDYQGEYELTPSRLALIEKYGIGIVTAIPEDQLTEEACKRLADAFLAKMRRADSPGGGVRSGEDFERRVLAQHMGSHAVESMGPAEVHAHYMGAVRRGLVELTDDQITTDFFDDRLRSQSGTFLPGGSLNPQAARRAYSQNPKERSTGKTIAATAGTAGLVGAALLATRKMKRAKVPKLYNKTIDVAPAQFARRTMPQSPFGNRPLKLIRRPKRGGKLLMAPKPMLPVSNFGNLAGSLAEGLIDAAGLGTATAPKKKKVLVDKFGNPITPPTPLVDPGLTATSSFGAIGRIGAAAGKYLPEAAVIAGGDIAAENIHDSQIDAKAKRRRRLLRQRGVEQTPGMGTVPGVSTTLSALHETLMEFDSDGKRDAAKRRAAVLGAAGVGGAVGAIGGLKYDQGSPVSHSDLKPGDRVYRRFGPGGLFQHAGVVDESGNVVHRTSGSSKYRSIKPDSFRKIGQPPTYREPSDLPRRQTAKNASKAAGTRAGKYCVGSNNCQTAVERIASKGKPVSGQLRRAVGGAVIGAAGAGSLVEILKHRRQQTQK